MQFIATFEMMASILNVCMFRSDSHKFSYSLLVLSFDLYVPSRSPWDQDTLIGRCGTIVFYALQATIFTYVTASFSSFFISTNLQFDAFRLYMKGLIDELENIYEEQNTLKEGDIQSMLRDIVRFHVVVKE